MNLSSKSRQKCHQGSAENRKFHSSHTQKERCHREKSGNSHRESEREREIIQLKVLRRFASISLHISFSFETEKDVAR